MRTARRRFIQYGCVACSMGIMFPKLLLAQAASKNVVHDLKGQLFINKASAIIGQELKPGDSLVTGKNSKATILFQGDAYHLKESTIFVLPNDVGANSSVVGGAVLAAFTPGKPKKIAVGDKTVLSIRGTGVYVEVGTESSDFCLCYGQANLSSNKSDVDVVTDTKFHKDFTIEANGEIHPTYWYDRRMTHTSRQNIELEKIAGRPSPFDGGFRDWISQFEDLDL
jgi:hypothetical protein